ncbi:MAG TPA: hypothetical protein VFQ51_07970 [Vicinamibacteria bacterium]|nr:hypothetical protein [Vicinamibacteria bacterium]
MSPSPASNVVSIKPAPGTSPSWTTWASPSSWSAISSGYRSAVPSFTTNTSRGEAVPSARTEPALTTVSPDAHGPRPPPAPPPTLCIM